LKSILVIIFISNLIILMNIIILYSHNPSSYIFNPFKSNLWFFFNSNNIFPNLIIIIIFNFTLQMKSIFFNINNIFFKFNKYYINNFKYNNIYNTNNSIFNINYKKIFIRQIIIFLISILLIIIKIIIFIIQTIIFRNLRPKNLRS
jgi:hypothetical protein